jgi:hypothetical protein
MAVTARSRAHKRPKKKVSAKAKVKASTNGHSNGQATKDYEVITLRIDREHKATLLDHCARRAKQEGKQMSFNRAIIEWIEGLAR